MAGGERGEGAGIRHRGGAPAPDHVQVWPDEDQVVVLVHWPRGRRMNLERREGRADPAEGPAESARGLAGSGGVQEREAAPQVIGDRGPVIEPDVRQPRARPRGRRVAEAVRVRPLTVLAGDEW